jgi:hypothetical protein
MAERWDRLENRLATNIPDPKYIHSVRYMPDVRALSQQAFGQL